MFLLNQRSKHDKLTQYLQLKHMERKLIMKKKIISTVIVLVLTTILILIKYSSPKEEIQLFHKSGINFVKASSVVSDIKHDKVRDWPAENIIDNNLTSHWCTLDNTQEWAYIGLEKDYTLSRIGFINGNGYWNDPKHSAAYSMDARIKDIHVELSNGWEKDFQLQDHGDIQFFDMEGQKTDFIKFSTQSLYMMEIWGHACLSEVQVFAIESPQKEVSSSKQEHSDLKNIKDPKVLEIITELNKKIEVNPKDANNYIALGQIYMKLKLYFNAQKEFSAAIKITPSNGKLHYLKALSHLILGEKTEGIVSISRSLDIFSSTGKEEEFKEAFALLRKFKENSPEQRSETKQ